MPSFPAETDILEMPVTIGDEYWIRRALRLASLGREASPNPMVGCVIVSEQGVKVGEGWHVRPGEPHAEINALRSAGILARNGTAYVTLEPCSHFGRTPPCADALIAAGVKRVVAAMIDPDSRVSGRGIRRMRDAGITADVGVCHSESMQLNAAFVKHRATGLPYVTCKMAMTLDGKIATSAGDSRWITSPITRLWVHRQLRARNQAVMVGVGTVLTDDPSLTVRLLHRPQVRQPFRIIVDSHLQTPLDAKVIKLGRIDGKTIIAYTDDPFGRASEFREAGIHLLKCEPSNQNQVDLKSLLTHLGTDMSIASVLVEGGATLNGELFRLGLVDRYIATIAPKIIGGINAPGPVGGLGLSKSMSDAKIAEDVKIRRSGPDIVIDCKFMAVV